jgi:hypothetical protein
MLAHQRRRSIVHYYPSVLRMKGSVFHRTADDLEPIEEVYQVASQAPRTMTHES